MAQKCKNAADVMGTVASRAMAKGAVPMPAQLGSSLPTIHSPTPSRKTISSRAPATCWAHSHSTPDRARV